MNENLKEDIPAFFADVKEQILYLQELGVENFAVDLPEISFSSTPEISRSNAEIPRERLENFVPAEEILKDVASPVKNSEDKKANEARRGILEETKLSNLPEQPFRNSYNFTNQKKPESAAGKKMPKKPTVEIPSLFGDISQALPDSNETIEAIRAEIGECTRCPLYAGRTKIVHSTGHFQADLMFVGEAPGADEDAQGEPFVGRAGQLLTKIIEGVGMKREEVLIGNINRCRPPGNRQPTLEESAACKPYLLREIAVVRPKVIVVLGNTATQNLLETKVGITKLRGNFQDYYGVKVMPTFHPAYLLRDPRKKREVWEDMKKVRDEINKLK